MVQRIDNMGFRRCTWGGGGKLQVGLAKTSINLAATTISKTSAKVKLEPTKHLVTAPCSRCGRRASSRLIDLLIRASSRRAGGRGKVRLDL